MSELGDPWAAVQRTTSFAPRTGNKRKRRAPFTNTLPNNHPLLTPPSVLISEESKEDNSSTVSEPAVVCAPEDRQKRTMRPAINWMSVRDERKALNEIRNMESPLEHAKDKLKSISIDLTVETFALYYVIG